MKALSKPVQHPADNESIAPVRILDGHGNVVRVLSASEFRRTHPRPATAEGQAGARHRQSVLAPTRPARTPARRPRRDAERASTN